MFLSYISPEKKGCHSGRFPAIGGSPRIPLLVGISLIHRIVNGYWESIGFMALVFAAVIAFYWFTLPPDFFDEDDDTSGFTEEET